MRKCFQTIVIITAITSVISDNRTFPSDFKFGVATASYQIEGGWNADGKGENIWDRLTHTHPNYVKGKIKNGDIACDSYHSWREDVNILKDLGVDFYRFSLSWSRILPSGFTNHINMKGVKYYDKLIESLLENNIEPIVTLYHWDLPQSLQDVGGWPNPLLADYFVQYANISFQLFGDRVKKWITFNEPPQICPSGYGYGDDAPAIKSRGIGDYLCGHTLLLAHARAYHLYDKVFRPIQKGTIGISVNSIWCEPKTNNTNDIMAADRLLQMDYGWWTHPIFSKTGNYPEVMIKRVAAKSAKQHYSKSRLPAFSQEEIDLIRGSADFLGLNHYSTYLCRDCSREDVNYRFYSPDTGVCQEKDPHWKPSSLAWLNVVPWGFRKLLNWIKDQFGNPLVYVTENGFVDKGTLNDTDRIDYHKLYLEALLDAIYKDGCNVKAYTVWSLMDNMEWREGYTAKFGLYQVDFDDPSRERTPKASAEFYKKLLKDRKIPDGHEPQVVMN